jgi:hypothetical protein
MNREDAAARDAAENLIADAIEAAEEIRDPLDDLVARSWGDPGLAFMPEVLKRLASLRKDDRAAFEALRAHLKGAGCRVTALDEAIAEQDGEIGGRGPKQADILIDLAQAAEPVSFARREWVRRSRHQRSPRDLAHPIEGIPSLAGAPLLRDDRRRAEFGGAAIGAQRHRS